MAASLSTDPRLERGKGRQTTLMSLWRETSYVSERVVADKERPQNHHTSANRRYFWELDEKRSADRKNDHSTLKRQLGGEGIDRIVRELEFDSPNRSNLRSDSAKEGW